MSLNILDKSALAEIKSNLTSDEKLLLFGKYSHKNDFVYFLLFLSIVSIAFCIFQFQVNLLADPTLPVLFTILVALVYFRWVAIEKQPYFAVTDKRLLSYGDKVLTLNEGDINTVVSGEFASVKTGDLSVKFSIIVSEENEESKIVSQSS